MILAASLFGSKHIMGLFICVVVIGVMFLLDAKVIKRDKKVMMYVLLASFFVLEILKIGTMWINKGAYPMNHLPFHLCSLPLYLVPLVTFVKNEKWLKFILPATVAGLMFGGLVAMLYPVNIIGDGNSFLPLSDNFIPLVSFIYHPLMIFTAVYLVLSEIYVIDFKKFIFGYPVIVGFMVIAMIANAITGQDFMLLNTGNGSPFQFLIETSQILYVLSMIGLGLIGIFIFHSITFAVTRPFAKK